MRCVEYGVAGNRETAIYLIYKKLYVIWKLNHTCRANCPTGINGKKRYTMPYSLIFVSNVL